MIFFIFNTNDEYAISSDAVNFNTMMAAIKNYIQEASDCRHKARLKDHAASEEKKYIEEKQTTFLKIEVKRMLSELERLLDINIAECSHSEVLERRTSLNEVGTKMNNISKNLSKLFSVTADAAEVASPTKCYEHLSVLFGQY